MIVDPGAVCNVQVERERTHQRGGATYSRAHSRQQSRGWNPVLPDLGPEAEQSQLGGEGGSDPAAGCRDSLEVTPQACLPVLGSPGPAPSPAPVSIKRQGAAGQGQNTVCAGLGASAPVSVFVRKFYCGFFFIVLLDIIV